MRWKARDQRHWRLMFAWLPVKVEDHWVWLEDVYTRIGGLASHPRREYRLFDDGEAPEPPRETL